MSDIVLNHELVRRIAAALQSGYLPPIEFHHLTEDIKGDQRVAALRTSITGSPDSCLTEAIDLKRRYLAVRYDEWLEQVGA